MTLKKYSIHGTVKGKNVLDTHPAAHVWASSPEEAKERAHHIIKNNPIYNMHFGDKIEAKGEGEAGADE